MKTYEELVEFLPEKNEATPDDPTLHESINLKTGLKTIINNIQDKVERAALTNIRSRMGEVGLSDKDKQTISTALDSIDMAEKELKDLKKLFGEK